MIERALLSLLMKPN